jgi:hypothetical protein
MSEFDITTQEQLGAKLNEWLANNLATFATHLINKFVEAQREQAEAFGGTLESLSEQANTGIWDAMLDMFVRNNWINEDAKTELLKVKNATGAFSFIFYLLIFYSLISNYVGTLLSIIPGQQRQELQKRFSPFPLNPESIIQAAFIAPEKTGEVREAMKRSGIKDSDIDLLFLSSYRLYDLTMCKELYLRGIIDNAGFWMRMRELGFTDARITEIMSTFDVIPSISDILYMVAKEAFEPDSIEKLGLDQEFPQEQADWLRKLGLSDMWQHKYWQAHWDQPSIGQGFEMLQRGVINRADLEFLFREIEIAPYWRDKLLAISYNIIPRVDIRRMHEMGIYNDAELIRAYQNAGYNLEDATKLAEFTKRYNESAGREVSQATILKLYIEKIISKQEAKDYLIKLKYDENEADMIIAYEEWKEEDKYRTEAITLVQDSFKNSLIDEDAARIALSNLGVEGRRVDLLISKWSIIRENKITIPPKTDLDKLYISEIITEADYRNELYKLGYRGSYIEWYVAYANEQRRGNHGTSG